jgi:D-alanine-D-alanine ligase
MSNVKVAILVPPEDPDAPADEADTFVQAREIHQCLTMLGNDPLTVVFGPDRAATADALRRHRPDVVVNLVEDLPEGPDQVFRVTECLDRLGLPYTGAGTRALRALADKRGMKRRLHDAGLPVPDDLDGRQAPGGGVGSTPPSSPVPPASPPIRYIVKSAIEHASIGIDGTSLVAGAEAAAALLAARRAERGGAWLAEQFIDGREFNVAILETPEGPRALPPAEILFLDPTRPRILGYEEKWAEASAAYSATPRRFSKTPADAPLLAELTELALAAWRAFDLTGYARVDFRVDEAGNPYILEVNANPCLSADAGFCAAAREAGLTQADIVARLIETALVRTHPLAPDR